jgi:hypothetical protein
MVGDTWRARMLQEQMINFLEATIIFLLMTNAVSVFAATYAIRIAKQFGSQ